MFLDVCWFIGAFLLGSFSSLPAFEQLDLLGCLELLTDLPRLFKPFPRSAFGVGMGRCFRAVSRHLCEKLRSLRAVYGWVAVRWCYCL